MQLKIYPRRAVTRAEHFTIERHSETTLEREIYCRAWYSQMPVNLQPDSKIEKTRSLRVVTLIFPSLSSFPCFRWKPKVGKIFLSTTSNARKEKGIEKPT